MTPRQRADESELRARARDLLAKLDAFKVDLAEVRRFLLAEPGVRLLATKTRRRVRTVPARRSKVGRKRVTERLDLIAYRPGGARRASYYTVCWACGWQDNPHLTLAEARAWYDGWGAFPDWYCTPVIIAASE